MSANEPPLVFDVGVHDGADSAYYLRRGFQVVAIEASPVMAAAPGSPRRLRRLAMTTGRPSASG